MNRSIKYLILFLVISIGFFSIENAQPKTSPKKVAKQTWHIVERPSFTLMTDAGEKRTKKMAHNLERFRLMFSHLTNAKLEHTVRPITIIASKREHTFAFIKGHSDALKRSTVFFKDSINGNYAGLKLFNYKYSEQTNLRALFHGYTYYASANLTKANSPYWYRKGFADYMSTLEFEDELTVNYGKPFHKNVRTLDNEKWVDLEQVLTTNYVASKHKKLRSQIFAQGWLLTHYLSQDSEKLRLKNRLFKLLNDGVEPVAAIEQSSGLSFSEFEKDLRKYSRRKLNYQRISLSSPLKNKELAIRKLSKSEAVYRIGDFILQAGRGHLKARPYFEKALEIDPQYANAMAGLANTYLGKDIAKMTNLIDEAQSIEPDNPWAATVSGHLYSWKRNIENDKATKKIYWNKAIRNYNLALSSETINLEALLAAASLCWDVKKYDKYIELIELAYIAAPSNFEVQSKLIKAYLSNNQHNKAQSLATSLRKDSLISAKSISKFDDWYEELLNEFPEKIQIK